MLNLEDDDFIREYRNSRFHRFREIEDFDILKQINLEEKLNERIRENR